MAEVKTTLKVKGMTCGHCAGSVARALQDLDGVEETGVNLEKGLAEVTYHSEKVSAEDLAKAVIDAGYEATVA